MGFAQLADRAGVFGFQCPGHLQARDIRARAEHIGVVDAFRQRNAAQDGAQRFAHHIVQLRQQPAQIDLAAQVVFYASVEQVRHELRPDQHGLAHGPQVQVGAGVGQLVGQPALDGAIAHHHQPPAQRVDARAQAQCRRVGIDHETVGQQRVFAHDFFEGLQRLLGVYGLHQLEDDGVRGLGRLVPLVVEHVFRGPPGQCQGVLLIQTMLHECAAGDVFIHLACQHRAFGVGHRRRATRPGGGGLQCRHGVFGAQRKQAVVKATRHLGPGQAGQVAAPHQLEAALVRRLDAGQDGTVGQPVAPHLDPGCAARGVIQQRAQKLARLRRQQKRW